MGSREATKPSTTVDPDTQAAPKRSTDSSSKADGRSYPDHGNSKDRQFYRRFDPGLPRHPTEPGTPTSCSTFGNSRDHPPPRGNSGTCEAERYTVRAQAHRGRRTGGGPSSTRVETEHPIALGDTPLRQVRGVVWRPEDHRSQEERNVWSAGNDDWTTKPCGLHHPPVKTLSEPSTPPPSRKEAQEPGDNTKSGRSRRLRSVDFLPASSPRRDIYESDDDPEALQDLLVRLLPLRDRWIPSVRESLEGSYSRVEPHLWCRHRKQCSRVTRHGGDHMASPYRVQGNGK
jgi:hypothetical protein